MYRYKEDFPYAQPVQHVSACKVGPDLWLLPSAVTSNCRVYKWEEMKKNQLCRLPSLSRSPTLTDVNRHTGALMRKCLRRRGCYIKNGHNVSIVIQQSAKS